MNDQGLNSMQSFAFADDAAEHRPPSIDLLKPGMLKAVGFAARHSFSKLKRLEFERTPAQANEVELEILFCGVCHSDIHQVRNDWSNTVYPCLPDMRLSGELRERVRP